MELVGYLPHTCYIPFGQETVGDPSCRVQGERRGDPDPKGSVASRS